MQAQSHARPSRASHSLIVCEARGVPRFAGLVKEYSSFVAVDDVKLNGELTLGENTADNGGCVLR